MMIDEGPGGIWDRVAGAIIAGILVLITLIITPFICVALITPHQFYLPTYYFYSPRSRLLGDIYSYPLFIWVGFVCLGSMIYGAVKGTTRVLMTLSDLWGTSEDDETTDNMWGILILGWIVTAALLFLSHRFLK